MALVASSAQEFLGGADDVFSVEARDDERFAIEITVTHDGTVYDVTGHDIAVFVDHYLGTNPSARFQGFKPVVGQARTSFDAEILAGSDGKFQIAVDSTLVPSNPEVGQTEIPILMGFIVMTDPNTGVSHTAVAVIGVRPGSGQDRTPALALPVTRPKHRYVWEIGSTPGIQPVTQSQIDQLRAELNAVAVVTGISFTQAADQLTLARGRVDGGAAAGLTTPVPAALRQGGVTQAVFDALVARVAALEMAGGSAATYNGYVAWDMDGVVDEASILAGRAFNTRMVTLPASGSRQRLVVTRVATEGLLSHLFFNGRAAVHLLGTASYTHSLIDVNGVSHNAWISRGTLPTDPYGDGTMVLRME